MSSLPSPAEPPTHRERPEPLGPADIAGIAGLVVLLLVLSYFRSRANMFWSDEIMGWLVLTQPTWHGLLHLWRVGIDSSGIWFYVFGRPWIDIFGTSEVSLREFSATGIAASAAIIWITARRYYALLPVAASISFIFSATLAVSWQLANGRAYGLFLLASSLVIYLLLRGEDPDTAHPSWRFLAATFAAYTFLAGSHILGGLYCGVFLVMQLGFDLFSRRFRPLLYLSAACSFGVVLFSRANILATAALGKPVFWTPRPLLRYLVLPEIVFDHRVYIPFGYFLLILLLSLRIRRQRVPVYFLFAFFFALNAVIWAYSRVATSIYVDRYMLPFSIIAVLMYCELFTQLREADALFPRLRAWAPVVALLLAAAGFFVPLLKRRWLPIPNYTNSLLAALPPGVPVVDTDVGSFVEMHFYQGGSLHRPFLFPADRQVALDPAHIGGVSGFHEMDNFKTYGLYSDDIVPTAQILDRYRDFVVITSVQTPTRWLQRRVESNPEFSITDRGIFSYGLAQFHLWVVKRN